MVLNARLEMNLCRGEPIQKLLTSFFVGFFINERRGQLVHFSVHLEHALAEKSFGIGELRNLRCLGTWVYSWSPMP